MGTIRKTGNGQYGIFGTNRVVYRQGAKTIKINRRHSIDCLGSISWCALVGVRMVFGRRLVIPEGYGVPF